MSNWIVVSEGDLDSKFTEVSLEKLPVVQFSVNFEHIIEGVHFNLARKVTGEDLRHNVPIRKISEKVSVTYSLGFSTL